MRNKGKEYLGLECCSEKRSILQRLKMGDKTAFVDLFKFNNVNFIDEIFTEINDKDFNDEDLRKILQYVLSSCCNIEPFIFEFHIADTGNRCSVFCTDENFFEKLSECFQISPNEKIKVKSLLSNEEGIYYKTKKEAKGNALESLINYLGCKKRTTKEIPNEIKTVFWYARSYLNKEQRAFFSKRYKKFEFIREIFSENFPITLKEEEITLLDAAYRKDEDLLRILLKSERFDFYLMKKLSVGPIVSKILNECELPMEETDQKCEEKEKELKKVRNDLDIQDKNGQTSLMGRAEQKRKEKELKKVKNDLNVQDKNGQTSLIRATKRGLIGTVRDLIEEGANLDIQDNDGKTALMWAEEIERLGGVKKSWYLEAGPVEELIKAGANLNIQDNDGCTALILAAKWNNEETVSQLVKAGADINKKDKNGRTALEITYNERIKQIISCFEINQSLIRQADWGNVERVLELLDKGAKVDILKKFLSKNYWGYEDLVDKDGRTLLMSSLVDKKNSLSLYLMMKNADLNAKDNEGNNVLKYILENGDLGLLRVALDNRFKRFSQDKIIDVLIRRDRKYEGGFDLGVAFDIIDLNSVDNKKVIKDFIESNPAMAKRAIKILVDNGLIKNNIIDNDMKLNEIQCPRVQHVEIHNKRLSSSKTKRSIFN